MKNPAVPVLPVSQTKRWLKPSPAKTSSPKIGTSTPRRRSSMSIASPSASKVSKTMGGGEVDADVGAGAGEVAESAA